MIALREKLTRHLQELAFFLEYHGENPFRIRAYQIATEIIDGLSDEELERRIQEKNLTDLQGIGKGLASIADAFFKSETSAEWKQAKGDLPISLFELKAVAGLGAKKIRVLYEKLQITSIGELEYACNENRLVDLPSFGEKTQKKILSAIQQLKGREGKAILADALALAEEFEAGFPETLKFRRVGDLGRHQEIVAGLDYLIADKDVNQLKKIQTFHAMDQKPDLVEGTMHGLQIRFHSSPADSMPIRAIFLTSNDQHWNSLQEAATNLGMQLAADCLMKGKKKEKIEDEKALYEKLELAFFETFERELPATKSKISVVEVEDLTGVFHLHTTASDGANSLEEMAKAARSLRWKFLGLSDHSKSAFYARGLPEDALEKQWNEIEALNQKHKEMKILRGIESDILKDGSLDYSDSFLTKFDFVIASIHSRFGMTDMTERILKAIEHPETSMVGHLTGRLLLAREGYYVNHEQVIEAAIQHHKIIELNSHPNRLDIDWHYLTDACKKGLLISINPDAHSVEGLKDVRYGIWMARKAGVPSERILNTWPVEKIETYLGLQ
jgi:DNA polymerase (family 10)